MHELVLHLKAQQPLFNDILRKEADKLHPLVQPVVHHVFKAGGKRLRPLLTLLCARALGYKDDDVYHLACSLEFLHSATLLHDDILDDAHTRRGLPAAHTVFGVTKTILAGDALLALGNKIMAGSGNPRLTSCISDAIISTATGEIEEIHYVRNPELTEKVYLDIVTGKTAYLIQAACRCGAIIANKSSELEDASAAYGLNLGIAFQLVDDALDYSSSQEKTGKPVGADLREGKLTLPFLYFLESISETDRKRHMDKICANNLTDDDINAIINNVRAMDGAQKTRELAEHYIGKAEQAIGSFPDCPETIMLHQALQYVLKREK